MEENRENSHHEDNCFLCKHPMMKHLMVGLLVFLGAFAAFYVVTDWHFKRMLDPAVQMRKMENMIRSDARYMDKMANDQIRRGMRMAKKDESYIRLEKTDNSYKVYVDLRPFDNDEKNVEVTSKGNVLTINAAGSSDRHGHERILKISQNYLFDDNVDLENMTKMREGKDLVIYIPLEK